jgi:hypothetical protein
MIGRRLILFWMLIVVRRLRMLSMGETWMTLYELWSAFMTNNVSTACVGRNKRNASRRM